MPDFPVHRPPDRSAPTALRHAIRSWLPLALLALVTVSFWHMLTAFALTTIGGGRASILAFTMPLWATLLSVPILHERLGIRQILALLLGLSGIALLLLPELERPRFDEIRRQGEFGVQVLERTALADVVVFATPDIDSVSAEGRTAAVTSCTCERVALTLTPDGLE